MPVRIENVMTNLQNKGDQDESGDCMIETNEERTNNVNVLNTEDLEILPLGQTKKSDYIAPQKNGTRTNLIYDINHSVSPNTASNISRNENDSMLAVSSTQTRPKITSPCLPKQNNSAKSSSSISASGHKIINSEITHLNSRSNRFIVEDQSEEVIKAMNVLGKEENLNQLSGLILNHEVDSTVVLLMFRAMNNIQGINEDTNVLSTELKNNEEECKECENKCSEASAQPTERNTCTNHPDNKRKSWSDLSNQFNTVCEV